MAYDAKGRVVCYTDVCGRKTHFTYDGQDNVTSVTDPAGRQAVFFYDGDGRLVSGTDIDGTAHTYEYDEDGNLTSQSIAGVVTNYIYKDGNLTGVEGGGLRTESVRDAAGRIVEEAGANGGKFTYGYDAAGRCVSVTSPSGIVTELEYDGYGNLLRTTAGEEVTSYTYDGNGNLTNVRYPDGSTLAYIYDPVQRVTKKTVVEKNGEIYYNEYSYDGAGNVTAVRDDAGNRMSLVYDSRNRCVRAEDDRGNTVAYAYNADGTVSAVTDSSGTTQYAYDILGRLESVTAPDGGITRYETDARGNVTRILDALGGEWKFAYDAFGNLIRETDARGNVTAYTYDRAGRCTAKTDADGTRTTYEYDGFGNITGIALDNDGEILSVSWTYDTEGRPLTYTDERGYTVSCAYQGMKEFTVTDAAGTVLLNSEMSPQAEERVYRAGKTTQVTDALGGKTSLSLNADGTVKEYTDPQGNTVSYTYDRLGNLTKETDATGAVRSYGYDAFGRLNRVEGARGQVTAYSYDLLGRCIKAEDELGIITYAYDACGNLLTVTDEQGTIRRTYDSMNRVSTCTDTDGNTLCYEYDRLGNVTCLTYADGSKVTYGYEKGLLVKVTDNEGRTTEYERDLLGRITAVTNANGTREEYAYNGQGELLSQKTYREEELLRSAVYTYDENGNITMITVTGGENGEAGGTLTATAARSTSGKTTTEVYTYGADNRLATYNGQAVEYDADGNMTYGPVDGNLTTLTYDCRNRLISAGGVRYVYDAENVRTAIITQEYREIYVTDRVSVLSQVLERTRTYSDGTAETFRHVYGEGLISQEWACTAGAKSALAGMELAGKYLTFHYNHIGSTVMLTGEDGSITATYRYGVYGELLEGEAELTPFLYNGQYGVQTDKNGLNYMRARYYDSSMKRFVNRDILAGDIEDSQSLNRYAYCCGNPVSYMDPFGLSPLKNRVLHSVLDVVGMIPGGIGVLADGTNALIYLSEGNFAGVGSSLLFMLIPTDVIGKGAKLLGASKTGARIIQGLGGIGICGYGVYVNGSQTMEDIDEAITNWGSYSAEEKRLTAVLVACDIIGTVGPAVGSMYYAKDIASTEVYQAWEKEFLEQQKKLWKDNRGSAPLDLLVGEKIADLVCGSVDVDTNVSYTIRGTNVTEEGILNFQRNVESKIQEVLFLAYNYNLSEDTFLNHILDRHSAGSLYKNKSIFNFNFNIREAIDETLKGNDFILRPNTNGREGFIIERTYTNPIGSNKGQNLYTLKVVLDQFGNVVTAFPKK